MTNSHEGRTLRWRVLIAKRGGSEVLVAGEPARFHLPEIRIPQHERVARHLNREIQRLCNLQVVSIAPIILEDEVVEDAAARYHTAETVSSSTEASQDFKWAHVSELAADAFRNTQDGLAFQWFCDRAGMPLRDETPFGHLGWFAELCDWLRQQIGPRAWDGAFEQFQASASFSLIPFETKPRCAWFKAVGESNAREFRITQELAESYSEFVPRLIATRPEWNAWLAEECEGRDLTEIAEPKIWEKAAHTLAELQIATMAGTVPLLHAGAQQLRGMFAAPVVDRFFVLAETLVSRNEGATGEDLPPIVLDSMKAQIKELVRREEDLQIPDALGHLDLNSGNAIVSAERCTYLDWAEAYVGPPFLTFEYLLQSFRRRFGRISQEEHAVVESYLGVWEASAPRFNVRDAWAFTPALAVFAYAQRCLFAAEPYQLEPSRFTDYLLALLRKLNRELAHGTTQKDGVSSCA